MDGTRGASGKQNAPGMSVSGQENEMTAGPSPRPRLISVHSSAQDLSAPPSGNPAAAVTRPVTAAQLPPCEAPIIAVRDAKASLRTLADQLPLELWKYILLLLDERSVVAAERVNRGMFAIADELVRQPIEPTHEPWHTQVAECERRFAPLCIEGKLIGIQLRHAVRAARASLEKDLDAKFETALSDLAGHLRCLAVTVKASRVPALIRCLAQERGWQLAVLKVDEEVDSAFLATLEAALRGRGAKRWLHLELANTACLEAYDGGSAALTLRRLKLTRLNAADQTALLRQLPAARHLSHLHLDLACVERRNGGPMKLIKLNVHADLLEWLAKAPCLQELRLDGLPSTSHFQILMAYARNPAARTLCLGSRNTAGNQSATDQVCATRRQLGLPGMTFISGLASSAQPGLGIRDY